MHGGQAGNHAHTGVVRASDPDDEFDGEGGPGDQDAEHEDVEGTVEGQEEFAGRKAAVRRNRPSSIRRTTAQTALAEAGGGVGQ